LTSSKRRPRLTLRLRLTLLYGACFLVAGAALLAITYGLVAQSTAHTNATFVGGGQQLSLTAPAGATVVHTSGFAPTSAVAMRKLVAAGQAKIDTVVASAQSALGRQRSTTLNALLTLSGVALAIMALISIGLGYLLAGRALRPLRVMNVRARAITEDSLHERLDIGSRSDELGELGATFDDLLARLEHAFEAQRRFVANASHELRTPLTLERALVEVALADPDATVDSLRGTCRRVLASTEHQERVIDALLTLARSQAALERRETVDLGSLVSDGLTSRALLIAGIELDAQLEPAPVRGDRRLLERLVANLLDNAINHNLSAGAWIAVQSGTEGGRAELRIANPGAVVSTGQADELFEPFRRLDGDRTAGGGLGLGLSIVKGIVNAHGGDVEAHPLPGGGLEFRLRFPAVPPAAASDAITPAASLA
jgi:signal transduction histidine kinase